MFDVERRHGAYGATTTVEVAAALRDDALERVDRSTDDWWRDCCDRAIRQLARSGHVFSAADVADLIPPPDHPNRWGARFKAAQRAGVIEFVEYAPSKRATTKGSAVGYWRGARR